ncbi:MAG: recombinase family protein, partial [Acetanaerobacterium sp.]
MGEQKIAAAYIRVSTDDQLEYSPDSQLKAAREYAKGHDCLLPDDFIFMEDEGRSGRKVTKRPEFLRMIATAKIKPKPFDVILVWKFSRFARNREDSIVYKSMLRKQCGIDVISISEPIGEDKTSILIEALLEAMDEYYSINLAEEVKRGMTEKVSRGEPVTVPAFGYTIREKQYFPSPDTAPVVRMIFEDFISGMGCRDIAVKLNGMGILSSRGNRFENRTVEYILRNPVYIGKIRWNPTEMTRRNYEHPDIMIVDGSHEPLIDADTWNKAQEQIAAIKRIYGRYNRQRATVSSMLHGLV